MKSVIFLSMEIFTGNGQMLGSSSGSALTIGNFDGVHKGHIELLAALKSRALGSGIKITVISFDPHPSTVLRPNHPYVPLFERGDLKDQLELLGVDQLVLMPFTEELAQVSAEGFISKVLQPLNPRVLVVGSDFRFGKGRQGDVVFLSSYCSKAGIGFEALGKYKLGGKEVSTTRIKGCLAKGEVHQAFELLGRPFYLKGVVRPGQKRGHQLGCPTANLYFERINFLLKEGVYLTKLSQANTVIPSITNVGVNPTFDSDGLGEGQLAIETHCLKEAPDFYGKEIKVEFLKYCRPELKFASSQELSLQIKRDIEIAKGFFNL